MAVTKKPPSKTRPKAKRPSQSTAYGASAGLRFKSTGELIAELKEGLPVGAFETLRAEMEIPAADLANAINIAQRTLSRRRKSGRLYTDESERLYRIAALFDRAVEVLGDREAAKSWFKLPKRALGGKTPLEFADTEPGAREVDALLIRLEHGVFS